MLLYFPDCKKKSLENLPTTGKDPMGFSGRLVNIYAELKSVLLIISLA
jgi:hypothetical protein